MIDSANFQLKDGHLPVTSRAWIIVILLLWIAYPFLYPALHAVSGESAGVLSVPAVLLVAWLWGLRAGMIAALATGFVLNPLFSFLLGTPYAVAVVTGLPGIMAVILTTAVVGRFRDVSRRLERELRERARVEAALREHKDQYEELVELAGDIIYRTDIDGRFTYVNRVVTRILGYDPHEVLGRLFLDIVVPEARRATGLFYARLRRDQLADSYLEFPVMARDGSIVWMGQNVRILWMGDTVVGFQAVTRDVTHRRQVEAALRQSEQRYRSVIENIKEVVFQTDAAGRWTLLNPAWVDISGYSLPDSLNRPAEEFVHPDERAPNAAHFQSLLHGRKRSIRYETRLLTAGGDVRWIEVHAQVLLDARDVPVGTTGTISDFTETRRFEAEREARQKAEEMLRLKTAFLNNMSHEIRTPLTGILGFAEVLADEIEEPYRNFARRIKSSGIRLLDTLNSVLNLAQLEGNGMTLRPEPLDVIEEIQDVVQLLSPLAEEKGLTLHLQPDCTSAVAELDRACLNRIVTNLVGNAIKFTSQGSVSVDVQATDIEISFRVCDTGIGISEDFLPLLFSEFQQESSGDGRSHEGNGLGLAITRRLVELMDGRISVESRRGAGSTFSVVFPTRFTRDAAGMPGLEYSPEKKAVNPLPLA